MSTADEINKLNGLLKNRVITQEEFDSQKEKLLKSATPKIKRFITKNLNNYFCIQIARQYEKGKLSIIINSLFF